jgi:hypothetical protein
MYTDAVHPEEDHYSIYIMMHSRKRDHWKHNIYGLLPEGSIPSEQGLRGQRSQQLGSPGKRIAPKFLSAGKAYTYLAGLYGAAKITVADTKKEDRHICALICHSLNKAYGCTHTHS